MNIHRRLGSLVIVAFLAVAAQGAFAPSALGHEPVQTAATAVLTRHVGSAIGARQPSAALGRGELGRFVRDGSATPSGDPRTGVRCYPRGC